jgi:hypothetical protein
MTYTKKGLTKLYQKSEVSQMLGCIMNHIGQVAYDSINQVVHPFNTLPLQHSTTHHVLQLPTQDACIYIISMLQTKLVCTTQNIFFLIPMQSSQKCKVGAQMERIDTCLKLLSLKNYIGVLLVTQYVYIFPTGLKGIGPELIKQLSFL